jgi:hypothetical protein
MARWRRCGVKLKVAMVLQLQRLPEGEKLPAAVERSSHVVTRQLLFPGGLTEGRRLL